MRQKKCSECLDLKNISRFAFGKFGKFGRCSICKDCRNKNLKIYRIKLKQDYPWRIVLQHILRRCKWAKSGSDFIYYKSKGIKCELNETEIKYLWFRDRAFEMMKPNIDRLDSKGNYTLSNCHFMEASEHNIKTNKYRTTIISEKEVS